MNVRYEIKVKMNIEQVMTALKETNDKIGGKMKDLLSSEGLCFGVCKKNEREAEIQEELINIEMRLEENEIVVKDLRDIEEKTENDISKLKQKNKKVEAEIDRLSQLYTLKHAQQNVTIRKSKVKNANDIAHDSDINAINSLTREFGNKATAKIVGISYAQSSQPLPTDEESRRKVNEQTCHGESTEPSEENVQPTATKASNSDRTLADCGKRVNSDSVPITDKEDIEDKTPLQLIPFAKPSAQMSNDNRLERRNRFEVLGQLFGHERWVNNHKCVHQSLKKHCFELFAWDIKANAEKRKAIAEGNFQVETAQSLLLIDTSESMAENGAWEQACTFLHDYLNGLEEMAFEHNINQERVSLVTFGRRTEVVQHLTFDMQQVRHAFDNLELGGPTPLLGGLILMEGALNIDIFDVNGLAVYPKCILITDGKPTESDLIEGPDEINQNNEQGAKSRILGVAENISTLEVDFFCVPVGKKDNDFLQLFVEMSDGIMLNHTDGRNLARRLLLTVEASKEMIAGVPFMPFLPGLYWDQDHNMMVRNKESAADRAEKDKIVSRIRRKESQRADRIIKEVYRDTNDPKLPRVGSRVRRGPDRDPTNTIDKDGPGTIVGHSSDEYCVNVDWDNTGRVEKCLYGKNGLYEVVIVQEPRILAEEVTMAPGCIVVPGKDWQTDENFQGQNIKGISLAYNAEHGIVKVKWENGMTSNHIFTSLKEEIMLLRDHQRSSTLRQIEPSATKRGKRNKNIK